MQQDELPLDEETHTPRWVYGMYSPEPTWGPPKGPCHICQKKGWPGMNWKWTGAEWECLLSLTGGHDQSIPTIERK